MAMLRLASSKVGRLAVRAVSAPRILSEYIINVFKGSPNYQHSQEERVNPPNCDDHEKKLVHRFLVKALKSEIKSNQSKRFYLAKSMPHDFPFTIVDDVENPHEENITLRREFDGEIINVVVLAPNDYVDIIDDDVIDKSLSESDYDSDSDEEKEDSVACPSWSLDLTVNIYTAENGKSLFFEVSASANEIKIKSVSVMEPTDDRCSLPISYMVENCGNLQRALREFLRIRGIKKSSAAYLYKYMVKKSKKQHMLVLKKLKKYINLE